jgi:DNA end-binding protein Ku
VNDGKIVERTDMVKGYEFAKDQYVKFTPAELKALEEATTHSIDIGEFVPLESVDPVYFAGTYYLAPDKGGAKPYALLTTALREAKQCAVGRWISRGRENVIVIRPLEGGLAMHQLHFQAEVRGMKDLGIEPATVSGPELKLAEQLIEQLAAKRFEPSEFHDEFKRRVEVAIEQKVKGKEISLAEAPVADAGSNVIDLMSALKASLSAKADRPASERKSPKRASDAPRRRSARR